MSRLKNIAISADSFLFCLGTLGKSFPGETASSAAYRMEIMGRWQGKVFRPFIDWLFAWDGPEHCKGAYENEKKHLRLPEEQR